MRNKRALGGFQKEVLDILRQHPEGLSKYKICQLLIQKWISHRDNCKDETKYRPTFQVSYNAYAVLKSLERRLLVYQGVSSKKWCPVNL